MKHDNDDPKRCRTCAPQLQEFETALQSMTTQEPTKTEKQEIVHYLLSIPGAGELLLGENNDGTWFVDVGDHWIVEAPSAPEALRKLAAILEEH